MADNDQPSRLEAATVKAEAGSQIVSDFANLPAGQTVATASGNIPTLAGVIGTIQDEGDQAAADVRAKADAQVQAAIGTLVKKAGDSMTGLLILSGNPTSSLGAATKQYVDTGDAASLASSKTYTDQKIAAQPFSKYFESGQFTVTNGGLISAIHGLGGIPKFCGVTLKVTTANYGYSVGDTIELPARTFVESTSTPAFDMYYDSTRVYLQFYASGGSTVITILSKNGSGATRSADIRTGFTVYVRAFI